MFLPSSVISNAFGYQTLVSSIYLSNAKMLLRETKGRPTVLVVSPIGILQGLQRPWGGGNGSHSHREPSGAEHLARACETSVSGRLEAWNDFEVAATKVVADCESPCWLSSENRPVLCTCTIDDSLPWDGQRRRGSLRGGAGGGVVDRAFYTRNYPAIATTR